MSSNSNHDSATAGLYSSARRLLRLKPKQSQSSLLTISSQQLQTALDQGDFFVVTLNRAGLIKECNENFVHASGWQRNELIDQQWFDLLIQSKNRTKYRQHFENIMLAQEVPIRHESVIGTKNIGIRRIIWRDSIVHGEQGAILGLVRIGEDVTDLRKSEDQLRRLSIAVEQSPSMVMIVNTNGVIEYTNPVFTKVTGFTAEEVNGQYPSFLKSGKTSSADYKTLWDTITKGGVWRGVFQNVRKNGEPYWESASISPIRSPTGEITHYLAVKEDITEHVRLEEKFRLFVEAAPNGIVIVNDKGEIELINSEAERYFQYTQEELIGQSIELLVPDTLRTAHEKSRATFYKDNVSRRMGLGIDLCGRRKDGSEFPIQVGLATIETEVGKYALASIADVTKRRQLEEELDERNREIARSEALAVVGRMANMVAHDLRNPLSSIKMTLQIFDKKPVADQSKNGHELNSIALDQVRYMEGIINDLLRYSRPDQLTLEWISIDRLLDQTLLLAQRQLDESKVRVKTWFQNRLPTLHGDADKLRQVFTNLIINAVQAVESVTDRKPEITVTTHLQLGDDHPMIRVEICDNGCGIAAGQLEKCFEPFYTSRAKGTGLGLAIVKRIVEQHHGRVQLQSSESGGTCAIVTLPTGPISTDDKPTSNDGTN
ncbi:PAS domain S-box protein [Pseudomonadota bacterium]